MLADDPLQHLSRAAAFGAYLVVWLDMCLGVGFSSQVKVAFVPRWRVGDLHQFTGVLALGLLCMYIGVLVGVQQQAFTIPEIFVPFLRTINPTAHALAAGPDTAAA